MRKAQVCFFPIVAHLRQRKPFIHFPCLRVGLVSRRHHGWKWLIMRVSDDELECCRLPMGHMCQVISGRQSLRRERYLLLLITQMVDESLKACVILLEGI